MEKQRTLGTGSCLGQQLRRHDTKREPGVDKLVGQPLGGKPATLEDRVEPSESWACEAILSLGAAVEVLQPAFMRQRIADETRAAAALYAA